MGKPPNPDLDEFRRRLDSIDEQIVRLLAERTAVSRDIGEFKRAHQMPVRDPGREAALRIRLRELCQDCGLDPEFCVDLYSLILAHSRSVQ